MFACSFVPVSNALPAMCTTHTDLGLNVCFSIEMVLRILSMGGVFAYLSHPWNIFDAAMVGAGYTTFIPASGSGAAGLEGVKALRALRAMRPLRTITRCDCKEPFILADGLGISISINISIGISSAQAPKRPVFCTSASPVNMRACLVWDRCRFAALRSIVVCFLEAVPLLVSVAAMLFFFMFLFAGAQHDTYDHGRTRHQRGCMSATHGHSHGLHDYRHTAVQSMHAGSNICSGAFHMPCAQWLARSSLVKLFTGCACSLPVASVRLMFGLCQMNLVVAHAHAQQSTAPARCGECAQPAARVFYDRQGCLQLLPALLLAHRLRFTAPGTCGLAALLE